MNRPINGSMSRFICFNRRSALTNIRHAYSVFKVFAGILLLYRRITLAVYNNLIFGKNDADEESVLKAAKFSQADDFIMKLPLAYSTRLGEKGVNISGGQKQCIAIARALLKDPDILIMDEATSNLDNITEKAVENAINNQDITTIIIAHRLSTIKNCDVIYVMDNGRIVESGNHLQLLKQRGRYYDLWCSQF